MKIVNENRNLSKLKKLFNLIPVALLLLVFHTSANAQTSETKDEVLAVADEMPSYPGGPKALMDEIYKNITYPVDAREKGIEGRVLVRFVIDKDGKATQPAISKGLCPSIDNVVLAAISKISRFAPGKMAGKPVSVWYALPLTFKLFK
jgi:protein TonB